MGISEVKNYNLSAEEGGKGDKEKFAEILAMGEKERNEYFFKIASRYEQGMPIEDSVVRLGQEKAIAEDIENHEPVLIRGVWRTGKTSMAHSIRNHIYQKKNCLYESVDVLGGKMDIEEFKKTLGFYDVLGIVAGPDANQEKIREIKKEIEQSGKTPFEYLNDYLIAKGEKVFVVFDEAIVLSDDREKMKYLASLKNLSNIRLGIILHRIDQFEEGFKNIFEGFKTHFVRPLTLLEVGVLVRRPLGGKPITFTDSAIAKIFEITGGRPLEINNLCYGLFDPYSRGKKWQARYDTEDILEFMAAAKEDYPGVFDTVLHNYDKVYKMALGEKERKIVDRLIKENQIPVAEVNPQTARGLIDLSFLREDKEKGIYIINGTLFAERIRELKNPSLI